MTAERQTGITTRQMTEAPVGAVYVWVNSELSYPRRLALHLGRRDLQIVGPSWLNMPKFYRHAAGIVVDHAADLTDNQLDGLDDARRRIAESGGRG